MGGRLAIDLTLPADAAGDDAAAAERAARARAAAVARRVDAWAARLTRFDPRSDLSRLNADASSEVVVRPTLARALMWAEEASAQTGGIVDVTLLQARLQAERGNVIQPRPTVTAAWQMRRHGRGGLVLRLPGPSFDLDGIAKGWLADRALALLHRETGAAVDADGDIAIRLATGDALEIGIADPRDDASLLACLRVGGTPALDRTYGVATSGTSVHQWARDGIRKHHLIDPRTGTSAVTDIVQATVLAGSARRAEILAKTALILGCDAGLRFLDNAGALAAVLLLETGECVATSESLPWLAAA